MNVHVIRAIFRRNFVSYFSSPTGYVFICVFVFLSGFAAFWTDEFWNANLANLDQLNLWFPVIMLVFIPAITMSIWADERRQGTDELLLTIPATDFDVVAGKYLSAVAIFSVGLVFSYVCNLFVLVKLGNPDVGQFISTYIGYWFIGLMMLAVGMVASFLTHNLTVAFVLGALFNAPLVVLVKADSIIPNSEFAEAVKQWSVRERFMDFGRGVVSLSSAAYFLGFTALMLYLCMVLIGRRHWLGGRDGHSMLGHFVVRAVAVAVAVLGVSYLFRNHDIVRADVSSERLSSLSPDSIRLVKDLEKSDNKQPIEIHAYLSDASETPESYIATRLNLISTLREFEALGSKKLIVKIHNVQRFDDETDRAEHEYGIKPERVPTQVRGSKTQKEVMMGLAFRCGLEKVVVPFVGKSLPVEYEIARSLANVSEQKRKKLGLVTTDVRLGSLEGAASPLDELKKQYEVVDIDSEQATRSKSRCDAGLAALVALAGSVAEFCQRGEERRPDRDLRGSVSDRPHAWRRGRNHAAEAGSRRKSIHAAAAADAQGEYSSPVELAGSEFRPADGEYRPPYADGPDGHSELRRRHGDLAQLQPVPEDGHVRPLAARMGVRRRGQQQSRGVQSERPDQRQLAKRAVAVSRRHYAPLGGQAN